MMVQAKRRIGIAVLVALAVAFPLGLWATGQTEGGGAGSSGEMGEISFMVLDYGRDRIDEDLFVFDVMKEKIGVAIEPVPVLEDGFTDKINTMIAGGNLPDLLTIPYETAQLYGPMGVFADYRNDLPTELPELDALLKEYPEVMDVLPAEDGGMYSLPQISTQLDYSWVHGVRTDLLELQGRTAEEIQTLEDLYEYLAESKGMRDGLITYPWIPVRPGEELLTAIPDYFGAGGTANPFYTDDGFVYGPTTEKFRIYIQFLKRLYEERLVHPNFLGLSRNENKELFWAGQSAFFTYPEYLVEGSYNEDLKRLSGNDTYDFTAIWPVEFGGSAYTPRRKSAFYAGGRWNKAINAETDNLEAVYRFVNYVYGDEGSKLFYMGEEGTHYTTTPSGDHVWLLNFGWNSEAVGEDAPSYVEYGLANVRYILLRPYFPQKPSFNAVYEETLENADRLADPVPIVNLTSEEREEYANIMVTVSTYALENCADFVTGDRPMSEWDAFVAELIDLDVDRALAIYNQAISR